MADQINQLVFPVGITGGRIEFLHTPILKDLVFTITEGKFERGEGGQLAVFIDTQAPFAPMQKLNEKLGISKMKLTSRVPQLSSDPTKPTVFTSKNTINFPRGEKIFNPLNWREELLPIDLTCIVETLAKGALTGKKVQGEFSVRYNYVQLQKILDAVGTFIVNLA